MWPPGHSLMLWSIRSMLTSLTDMKKGLSNCQGASRAVNDEHDPVASALIQRSTSLRCRTNKQAYLTKRLRVKWHVSSFIGQIKQQHQAFETRLKRNHGVKESNYKNANLGINKKSWQNTKQSKTPRQKTKHHYAA